MQYVLNYLQFPFSRFTRYNAHIMGCHSNNLQVYLVCDDWQRSESMTVLLLRYPVCLESPSATKKKQRTGGANERCACSWIDCAQVREQRC